jgi:uncharacterized protein YlaI
MIKMRRLVYLYPRSWRERYQEEFIALLEQYQKPRVVDIFDILLGAIDAQIQAVMQNKNGDLSSSINKRVDTPYVNIESALSISRLKAQCMSCAKCFELHPNDLQYTRLKRGQTKLYICEGCNRALKEEAIQSSGVRPDFIDPVNYFLDK